MCPGFDSRSRCSYVGWVCCWFSSLLREVFLRFSPLLKNQHFQIPVRSGVHEHVLTSFRAPKCFVGKQITFWQYAKGFKHGRVIFLSLKYKLSTDTLSWEICQQCLFCFEQTTFKNIYLKFLAIFIVDLFSINMNGVIYFFLIKKRTLQKGPLIFTSHSTSVTALLTNICKKKKKVQKSE